LLQSLDRRKDQGPKILNSQFPITERRKSRTILLIDDDDVAGQTTKMMLMTGNYEVELVDNGFDAIALFDKRKFDLIICDLFMPGMNGWEVIETVRKKSTTLPIIIFTGCIDEVLDEQRDRIEQLGINELLLKPIRLKPLLEKIKPYLDEAIGKQKE
jgi:CheY-like chemotaxis protein